MHSDLIGKIEKARRYAAEPERIAIDTLHARFQGGNNEHIITLHGDRWHCDCTSFRLRGTCAHIITLQKKLGPMLSAGAAETPALTMHSDIISMVEKSRHYAHELHRVSIDAISARFHGRNNEHVLRLDADGWHCGCETFRMRGTCAHVMALQHLLGVMLAPQARELYSAVPRETLALDHEEVVAVAA